MFRTSCEYTCYECSNPKGSHWTWKSSQLPISSSVSSSVSIWGKLIARFGHLRGICIWVAGGRHFESRYQYHPQYHPQGASGRSWSRSLTSARHLHREGMWKTCWKSSGGDFESHLRGSSGRKTCGMDFQTEASDMCEASASRWQVEAICERSVESKRKENWARRASGTSPVAFNRKRQKKSFETQIPQFRQISASHLHKRLSS